MYKSDSNTGLGAVVPSLQKLSGVIQIRPVNTPLAPQSSLVSKGVQRGMMKNIERFREIE